MGEEPSSSFITSTVELKSDRITMFEWQCHTQSSKEVPHYQEILKFLDHRAQASEVSIPSKKHSSKNDFSHQRKQHSHGHSKPIITYATNEDEDSTDTQCPLCDQERHLLYSCTKFRSSPHDKKLATVKSNNLCMNCLGKGHFVVDCKSLHRCRKCSNPHHTLLHKEDHRKDQPSNQSKPASSSPSQVSVNTVAQASSNTLLMTCRISIVAPNGSSLEARALLDSGSSTSFIS